MKLLRKISLGISVIVLPTLVAVTGKFYINKQLTFEESSLVIWTIFTIMISISLVMSCYIFKKFEEVSKRLEVVTKQGEITSKQNEELKELIINLKSQSENNHYDNIAYMQATRELMMETED